MAADTMDLAFLKGWIGRATETEDIVTSRLVAEYRATFTSHLAETPADEAPPGLHWCLAPEITPIEELGGDGHAAKGGFLPPVPLPRRMWAGGEIETHAPLRVGDSVTRRSSVEDVSFKEGRSGPLCFVAVRHAFSTERGLAVVERHDIVYRSADRPLAATPKPPAAETDRHADLTWRVDTSPVLLFRYSAMTFNGHRIHYDQPYVTGVEGYAGLVVHGPIQATLGLNIVARLMGKVPGRFRFRSLAPLTAGQPLMIAGARGEGGRVACWARGAEGPITMEGEGLV
jgi:3-methylfumaryl-CoA hydratase